MPLARRLQMPEQRGLDDEALDTLFRSARTYSHWSDQPVSDDMLRELYELMKFAPTSANCCPARILFLRTTEAKERLIPALDPGNVKKTRTAPVTAIIGYDVKFYDRLPKLFPHAPDYRSVFVENPELIEPTAFRNGTLQGAYFIMAARSLGLDCGPMSGFDNEKVDREFFSTHEGKSCALHEHCPESHIRSNFLCNLGFGDPSKLHPRLPRLSFDEACHLL